LPNNLTNAASLQPTWSRALIRRCLTVSQATASVSDAQHAINTLPVQQLRCLAHGLWKRIAEFNEINLTKREVAQRAGMTVSWLDNSDSPKARRLRATGIRYGTAQTSPIRFPLSDVARICREDETKGG